MPRVREGELKLLEFLGVPRRLLGLVETIGDFRREDVVEAQADARAGERAAADGVAAAVIDDDAMLVELEELVGKDVENALELVGFLPQLLLAEDLGGDVARGAVDQAFARLGREGLPLQPMPGTVLLVPVAVAELPHVDALFQSLEDFDGGGRRRRDGCIAGSCRGESPPPCSRACVPRRN